MQDPYLMMRSDVRQTLLDLSMKIREFEEAPTVAEARVVAEQVRALIERNTKDIETLDKAVSVIARSPGRYRITEEESQNRCAFVKDSQDTLLRHVNNFHHLEKSKAGGASTSTSAASAARRGGGNALHDRLAEEEQRSNNDFIRSEMEKQSQIRHQHEVQMDDMTQGVRRVKVMAETITTALDDDQKAMHTLEGEMDGLSGRIKVANKRLDDMLRKSSDKGKFMCIVCLIIVLAVLIIMLYAL